MRYLGIVCSYLCSLCFSCSESAAPLPPFQLTDPGGDLEDIPQVLRLELSGLEEVPNQDIWLIQGELSSASQNKVRIYDVPDSVAKRRVPLTSYSQQSRRVFAATELLSRGERYSLIALGYGALGSVRISELEEPVLTRVGHGSVPERGFVTYCEGDGKRREWSAGSELFATEELPLQASLGLAKGVAEAHCVRLFAEPLAGEFFVPPTRIGSQLVSPGLVRVVPQEPEKRVRELVADFECADELALKRSKVCMSIGDSFLRIAVSQSPTLLELEGPVSQGEGKRVRQLFLQTEKGEVQTWGPLLPDTKYLLRVHSFGPSGLTAGTAESADEFSLQTGSPAPRWVLNEVLADPQGAEPQGEWIEVVNAGTAVGSLAEIQLWDSSGGVSLPDVSLEPNEYGLFVRSDFDFAEDQIPAAGALPIVVPSLGQNGLKNSGERVELREAEGRVLSSFPAQAGKAGQSIARISLWSSDDDPTQFVLHPAPGSSPGAPNGPFVALEVDE